LGGKVTLIGLIGDDKNGESLKKILKQDDRINQELIKDKSRNTTVKTRILGNNQQLIRLDEEKRYIVNRTVISKILKKIKNSIIPIDGIIIQDYDKGLINDNLVSKISSYASENNILIYVDPKKNIFPSYFNVRLFKPNLIEFNNFVGEYKNFEDSANKMILENNYQILLVTKGSGGMSLFFKSEHIKIPVNIRQVHDVSGAGDTVVSTFALCDLINLEPVFSAYISNIAAGKVCEKVGVVPITRKLLLNNIDEDFV
jgi:ADP-heptose synthase, bifunctional sugar kinase/adenylyltransferase